MEVTMHDALDPAKTADHVAMEPGEMEPARHEGLSDREALHGSVAVAVGEPDAPAGDLDDAIPWKVDSRLPVMVALDGNHGRNPPELREHGNVGDVPSVQDQLAANERFRNARGKGGERLADVGVGDDTDRCEDPVLAIRTEARQVDSGGQLGAQGESPRQAPRSRPRSGPRSVCPWERRRRALRFRALS